jgi:FKBP-type peptidyl-prolyl cis-trans isomerase SlyD
MEYFMNIAENIFVAIDYELSLESGEVADKSPEGQPLGFVVGTGQIIPGLEKALIGMTVGDESKISIEPEDAYGPIREELFQEIPRTQFPEDLELKIGMSFQTEGPQGMMMLTVSELKGDEAVIVDLNHPMAGKKLIFEIKVVEVREPSQAELTAGAGGCACGTDNSGSCGPDCSCG